MVPKDICFHQTLKDVTAFFDDVTGRQTQYAQGGGSLSNSSRELLSNRREQYTSSASIHDASETILPQLITTWNTEAGLYMQALTLANRGGLETDDLKAQENKFNIATHELEKTWAKIIDSDWELALVLAQDHTHSLSLQSDPAGKSLSLPGSNRR